MYTLKLNKYKQWIHTEETNIYQHEKLATKLQFLFPIEVDDNDITKNFIFTLQYADVGNVVHTETLEVQDELYKETFLRAILPVDSDITRFAGDITEMKVNITGSVNGEIVNIWTEETSLKVKPLKDLYDFVPDESLNAMNQLIAKNAAQIEALDILAQDISDKQADDLVIDDESKLHLSVKGTPIGDGVDMVTSNEDIDSVDTDAVLDLDELRGNGNG